MTDSLDIKKAVSACHNLAKQFQSFSKVADVLTELGDVQKHCESLQHEKSSLTNACNKLSASIDEARYQEKEAIAARIQAVKNRDKELEAQEAIAADIIETAGAEAAKIVAKIRVFADEAAAKEVSDLARVEKELSGVMAQVASAREALADLRREMAALKERL